ncbi:MAG: hypothetical protein R6U95_09720 [Bacteroidales bacterium]
MRYIFLYNGTEVEKNEGEAKDFAKQIPNNTTVIIKDGEAVIDKLNVNDIFNVNDIWDV